MSRIMFMEELFLGRDKLLVRARMFIIQIILIGMATLSENLDDAWQ